MRGKIRCASDTALIHAVLVRVCVCVCVYPMAENKASWGEGGEVNER